MPACEWHHDRDTPGMERQKLCAVVHLQACDEHNFLLYICGMQAALKEALVRHDHAQLACMQQ